MEQWQGRLPVTPCSWYVFPPAAVDRVSCSLPSTCPSSSARTKSCLFQPTLPVLSPPSSTFLRSLLHPSRGVWLTAPQSLVIRSPLGRWWSSSQPLSTPQPAWSTWPSCAQRQCQSPPSVVSWARWCAPILPWWTTQQCQDGEMRWWSQWETEAACQGQPSCPTPGRGKRALVFLLAWCIFVPHLPWQSWCGSMLVVILCCPVDTPPAPRLAFSGPRHCAICSSPERVRSYNNDYDDDDNLLLLSHKPQHNNRWLICVECCTDQLLWHKTATTIYFRCCQSQRMSLNSSSSTLAMHSVTNKNEIAGQVLTWTRFSCVFCFVLFFWVMSASQVCHCQNDC